MEYPDMEPEDKKALDLEAGEGACSDPGAGSEERKSPDAGVKGKEETSPVAGEKGGEEKDPDAGEKDKEEKSSRKKLFMKWAKRIFLVVVAIFLVRYFYKNIDAYRNLDIRIDWGIFCIAVLFYFAYKVTLASLWHYLTYLNGCAISYPEALTAYLYSILGKYIPGKVFMLLARIPPYDEQGKSIAKVTVCFFLENICTLLGAAFLFLVSLFFFPNDLLKQYQWAAIGLVIAFFICINPKIINFFLKYLGKLFKKDNLQIPISYMQMIKVVALFVLNWMVSGTGFYLLSRSIYPVPWSEYPYAAGVFGISCIIGILAVFAPSGIGVREGIMVMGLGLIMPEQYAVIISIVSRLWMSVSELILIGIAWIVNRIRKTGKKPGAGQENSSDTHAGQQKNSD